MSVTGRPDESDLLRAAPLLVRLAHEHGLRDLRLGGGGRLVADVPDDCTYFDIVAFEDAVESRLGWRPQVVPASAEGARPGRTLRAATVGEAAGPVAV